MMVTRALLVPMVMVAIAFPGLSKAQDAVQTFGIDDALNHRIGMPGSCDEFVRKHDGENIMSYPSSRPNQEGKRVRHRAVEARDPSTVHPDATRVSGLCLDDVLVSLNADVKYRGRKKNRIENLLEHYEQRLGIAAKCEEGGLYWARCRKFSVQGIDVSLRADKDFNYFNVIFNVSENDVE
jgi:hypothetical protein